MPISGLAELADTVPCHLLKYTDSELRSIIRSNPFYYMDKIPSGTYKGQDEDIATFGIKALLCVRADLDEDLVYDIHLDPLMKNVSLKGPSPRPLLHRQSGFMFNDLPIELHAGAERFIRKRDFWRNTAGRRQDFECMVSTHHQIFSGGVFFVTVRRHRVPVYCNVFFFSYAEKSSLPLVI